MQSGSLEFDAPTARRSPACVLKTKNGGLRTRPSRAGIPDISIHVNSKNNKEDEYVSNHRCARRAVSAQ